MAKYTIPKDENGNFIPTCQGCNHVVKYHRRNKPKVCPFCGDIYFDKQGYEYTLFHLQDDFYASCKKDKPNLDLLAEIYIIIIDYSKPAIQSILKRNSKGKSLTPMQMEEASIYCGQKTYQYYYKWIEGKEWDGVRTNFYNYLKSGPVLEALYKYGDHETKKTNKGNTVQHLSLNFELDDRNEMVDVYSENFVDDISEVEDWYIKHDKSIIISTLAIIDEANLVLRKSYGLSTALAVINGVRYTLRGDNYRFLNEYFDFYGIEVKEKVDKLMMVIRDHWLNPNEK